MAALPSSGGVRSLLAKFENSNSNSADVSPSRGRSSVELNDNAGNRPLSKVRASFVSVERNGQGSPTPGMMRRTESYGTDVDSNQRSATVSPTGQLETSSTSPFNSSPHKIRTALAAFQNDKVQGASERLASLAVKDDVQLVTATKPPVKTTKEPSPVGKPTNKPTPNTSTKQLAPPTTLKKSASAVSISKESSTTKNAPKSTAATKEKKSTATPTRSTATPTTRNAAHSDKPTGNRTTTVKNTASTTRSSTPSQDVSKKPAVQPSPNSRLASKSPTRPVRLPASLTTPTAASAARTGTLVRSQSHLNLRSSPKVEPAKTLSRKTSTLKADAAKLTTHPAPDRPKSRLSTTSSRAPQEESFLARMTRPTASSAGKMHDKVEPRSPPRLAKAAKVIPKREEPVRVVKEINEKPVQDSLAAIATAEVKVKKPAVEKAPLKEAFIPKKREETERRAIPVVETFKKEPEVSIPEPVLVPTALKAALEISTEPASEPTAEEPQSEAIEELSLQPTVEESIPEPPVESSTEPAIVEPKSEEVEVQTTQDDNTDPTPAEGLTSVPETVPEDPETVVQEPVSESKPQDEENKQDSTEEPVAEVAIPQEESVQETEEKTEEKPEVTEAKATEPEQSTEEPAKDSTEEAPIESSTETKEETEIEN